MAVRHQYASPPSLLIQSTVESSARRSQNCEPQTYVFRGKISFEPEASLYCLHVCVEIRDVVDLKEPHVRTVRI